MAEQANTYEVELDDEHQTEKIDELETEQVDEQELGQETEQVDEQKLEIEQADDQELEQEQEAEQVDEHVTEITIIHVNAPEKYLAVSPINVTPVDPSEEQVEPTLVYAGNDIILKVVVSCSAKCDLQGGIIEFRDQDDVLLQLELASFDGEVNETDVFTLKAPAEPGEYTWTAEYVPEFVPEEEQDTPHEQISTSISFYVELHAVSLSSWDAPFPVVAGSKFTLKIGAKCFAGCKLTGQIIEIYDDQGVKIASGTLGDEPWRDTVATYWVELEIEAPAVEGLYEWEFKFPKLELEYSHEEATYSYVFRAVKAPEHLLTIEVVSDIDNTPVVGAWAGVTSEGVSYRGWSDDAGRVSFNVPKGDYSLLITADDHQAFEDNITVNSDLIVKSVMMYFFDSYK